MPEKVEKKPTAPIFINAGKLNKGNESPSPTLAVANAFALE